MTLAAFLEKYEEFMSRNPDLNELAEKLSELLALREQAEKAAE